MKGIYEIFFSMEGFLIAGCLFILIWGIARNWELEILMPIQMAIAGTFILIFLFLVAVFFHDHISVNIHGK